MLRIARFSAAVVLCAFLLMTGLMPVAAADGPDLSQYGFTVVSAKMDLSPAQNATITAGDQSVAIKAGTFDNPVTFELLTATPSTWQGQVNGRTVRAAFAFRVTDKTTNAILATFKQPVTYTYSGKDAQSSDVILNVTPTMPPMITVNGTPPTFDTALHHTFGGTGVGWLVASGGGAMTGGATTGSAAAATGTGGGTVRTGTAAATTPAAVLPPTGKTTSSVMPLTLLALTIAGAMLCAGALVRQHRATGRPPAAG